MAGKHPPDSGKWTSSNPPDTGGKGSDDVLDADYETLVPPPAKMHPPAANSAPAAVPKGIDLLRARGRDPESRVGREGVFWVAGILLVAAAFWTSGGHAIVERLEPKEEQPSFLHLKDIRSRLELLGDRQFLIVDGKAVNMGARAQVLPDLSIDILSGNGRTARYFLGTKGQRLARGERFSFSSRLAAPKDGVESISVTFKEYPE